MSESSSPRRLPRGRYALSREEVDRIQRSRLCAAMADVMVQKGYVATSVEDVLKRAQVSRQTFYQLFDSKLDCFMATFDHAGKLLLERILATIGAGDTGEKTGGPPSLGETDDPLARFEQALNAYLDALAAEWPYTRLFLVEVYAAGPDAIRRRTDLQDNLTHTLANLMGATDEAGRFACHVIVAAMSTMVTKPVAENDPYALAEIGPPMMEHVRRLWAAGAFGEHS